MSEYILNSNDSNISHTWESFNSSKELHDDYEQDDVVDDKPGFIAENARQETFDQGFKQHPDVRTLEGVDTEHVSPDLAARAELLQETSERLPIDEVPHGGVLKIQTPNGEVARFRRGSEGEYMFINDMERLDSDKEELPVKMIGTTITPSVGQENTDTPNVVKGFYFHFATEARFRDGDDPSTPERFGAFGRPEELTPEMLVQHLDKGSVIEGNDGKLYWNLAGEEVIVPVETFEIDETDTAD